MSRYLVLFIGILLCISPFYIAAVQAEGLLHLDGGLTDEDLSDAAFFDRAKGNHALPVNADTGETGLGDVEVIEQTSRAIIGDSAILWTSRNSDHALNIAADNPDFNRSYDAFSIALWYNPNNDYHPADNNRFLAGKMGGGGNRGWQFARTRNLDRVGFTYFDGPNGINHTVNAYGPISASRFTHIAVTFEANEMVRIYFDGVEVESDWALPALSGENDVPLQIGNRGTNATDGASGILDDVGIWDETLSAQRVAAIYTMGYFEGKDLQDASIDNLLSAFDNQGATVVNCNVWEYTSGLSGGIGNTGGSVEYCDAYVVLDENGNGMAMSSCPGELIGDISGDCTVDYQDLIIMAEQWLETTLPVE